MSSQRPVRLTEKKLQIAEVVTTVAREIGRSAAQVAINWLLSRPGVVSPILGARRLEQITDNLGALEFSLDDAHLKRLDEVSAVPLGFPHDMLASDFAAHLIHGGSAIETRVP